MAGSVPGLESDRLGAEVFVLFAKVMWFLKKGGEKAVTGTSLRTCLLGHTTEL